MTRRSAASSRKASRSGIVSPVVMRPILSSVASVYGVEIRQRRYEAVAAGSVKVSQSEARQRDRSDQRPAVEAGARAGVAGRAGLVDRDQDRVAVAVQRDGHDPL